MVRRVLFSPLVVEGLASELIRVDIGFQMRLCHATALVRSLFCGNATSLARVVRGYGSVGWVQRSYGQVPWVHPGPRLRARFCPDAFVM